MNILYIVTWYTEYGASFINAGIFHYEQIVALQKTCNVMLYYPFGTDINENYIFSEEHGILTYRRKYRGNRLFRILDWITDIKKIKDKYKIDLIHAHVAGGAGVIAAIASKILKIPFVITEHNPIQLSGLENRRNKRKIEYVYRNAKKVFCVSPYLKSALTNEFPSIEFEVMYNGVNDPNAFLDSDLKYRKEGVINCAICASFYDKEIKGFQFLLPAIKNVRIQGYNIILHICGGGTYLDYYKNFSKQLEIDDCCIFYGQCEKKIVYNIMNDMDFVISASLFESAGVSIQESLLLGLPVLVTKSGGTNSLVNSDCSVVVDVGSSKALENGIIEMTKKIKIFDSNKIKSYAKSCFCMDRITNRYEINYSEILKIDE